MFNFAKVIIAPLVLRALAKFTISVYILGIKKDTTLLAGTS